jgi:hypothetical protein
VASSHTSQSLSITFDDRRVISHAGLVLTSQLAASLGLRELIEQHVDLGKAVGHAHVADKTMTLLASLLVGGECIDDAAALRAPGLETVLGHRVLAPSTLGTFLRSFRYGHSRQLDLVSGSALKRAWELGAGPGEGPLTIDLDTTICETYGLQKQGADRTYAKGVKGYQPFLATRAEGGEVLHSRLRRGSANSHRGAAHFTIETLNRVRRAGASGPIVVRADSGFYAEEVVWACRDRGVRFSITIRQYANVQATINQIPESDWTPVPWAEGSAEVAETQYLAFANSHRAGLHRALPTRLIVRRVQKESKPNQPWLPGLGYEYQAFITDREGTASELEADHRRHAVVENEIRELKYDLALNHMPSGSFAANAVWLALNVIAHNLCHWLARLGLGQAGPTIKTLRRRLLSIPGRLACSGRRQLLRLPSHWPWAAQFLTALNRIRALGQLRPSRT